MKIPALHTKNGSLHKMRQRTGASSEYSCATEKEKLGKPGHVHIHTFSLWEVNTLPPSSISMKGIQKIKAAINKESLQNRIKPPFLILPKLPSYRRRIYRQRKVSKTLRIFVIIMFK